MTKIAFKVNDRSGFVRANLVPLKLSQKAHWGILGGALVAISTLGVMELVFFLAR
jgi:hypothetical protein